MKKSYNENYISRNNIKKGAIKKEGFQKILILQEKKKFSSTFIPIPLASQSSTEIYASGIFRIFRLRLNYMVCNSPICIHSRTFWANHHVSSQLMKLLNATFLVRQIYHSVI